jgi:hypothetical protein
LIVSTVGATEYASAVIRGEQKARDFLHTLRCVLGGGDELARAVQALEGDAETLGFCRVIQKFVERTQRA